MPFDTAMELLHYDLTDRIIRVFYGVYNELGSGFLEQVVQAAMVIALTAEGLDVTEHTGFPVFFRGEIIGEFFPDLSINGKVLVELKSKRAITLEDEAQGLNYLRVSDFEVLLILNFGPKPEVVRRVMSNARKRSGERPIRSAISVSNRTRSATSASSAARAGKSAASASSWACN